jgi:hypothetical protein
LEKAYAVSEVKKPDLKRESTKKPPLVVTLDVLEKIKTLEIGRIFNDPAYTVKWQDLANLDEQLLPIVKAYSEKVNAMTPERRNLERLRILNHIGKDEDLKALFDGVARFEDKDYLPTQYELKKEYVLKLIAILRELPEDFRPRVARVAYDPRTQRLNGEAEEFVKKMTDNYPEYLKKYTDVPYEDYVKSLRRKRDPFIKRALQLLDQSQVEVVIRRPESGRFWVPRVGFHNQYITNSSRGSFDHQKRMEAEALLTATNHDEYVKLDNELKPKYGTLMATFNSKTKNNLYASHQYGEDFYVADMEKIKDRLSFTFGDSLSYGWYGENNKFSGRFIPWKYRYLLTELIASSLKRADEFNLTAANLEDLQGLSFIKDDGSAGGLNLRYYETQIYGRFDLDSIKEYFFSENPPEGEFLAELRKRKIKIYDYRTGVPKLWRNRA